MHTKNLRALSNVRRQDLSRRRRTKLRARRPVVAPCRDGDGRQVADLNVGRADGHRAAHLRAADISRRPCLDLSGCRVRVGCVGVVVAGAVHQRPGGVHKIRPCEHRPGGRGDVANVRVLRRDRAHIHPRQGVTGVRRDALRRGRGSCALDLLRLLRLHLAGDRVALRVDDDLPGPHVGSCRVDAAHVGVFARDRVDLYRREDAAGGRCDRLRLLGRGGVSDLFRFLRRHRSGDGLAVRADDHLTDAYIPGAGVDA